MATGNLFLGTARKKLGDVVMYRRDGTQQSRVRVRSIANPKTEAQALQRNYLAPVAKFYAPLASVLETSWEGLSRSKSYTAFLKRNVTLARENGWYCVKGAGFTPMPYQLSYGILAPLNVGLNASDLVQWRDVVGISGGLTVSSISQKLVADGYQYGDQLTFVAVAEEPANSGLYRPVFGRFLLSASDMRAIRTAIPSISISQTGIFLNASDGNPCVGGAVIISRYSDGKWLRSTQTLVCRESYVDYITEYETREAAIASYRNNAGLVSSDVYLNGGTSSSGGDVVPIAYVRNAAGTQLYIVTPQSTSQDGNFLVVNAVAVANGSSVSFYVKNGVKTSDNYGKALSYDSSWLTTALPSSALYVEITPGSLTDFNNWLFTHGIDNTIFDELE